MFNPEPITKARPPWQDVPIGDPSLRQAYAIADKYWKRFGRAFKKLTREVLAAPETLKAISNALRSTEIPDPQKAVEAVHFFDPDDPESFKHTRRALERVYGEVMDAAWNSKERRQGAGLGALGVAKAVETPADRARRIVSQNIEQMMVELSNSQRELIIEIVTRGLEEQRSIVSIVEEIRLLAGLTKRQAAAAQRTFNNTLKELTRGDKPGERTPVTPRKIEFARAAQARYVERLLSQRAETIARTEMVRAQNEADRLYWEEGQAQGIFVTTDLKVWLATQASDLTCEICRGLHGQAVPITEDFYSKVLGRSVRGPPSHPRCRCTQVLRILED